MRKKAFRVMSPTKGMFVLRMYEAPGVGQSVTRSGKKGSASGVGLLSSDTLRAQLLWLSALGGETDLLVPEPVPTTDGSLIDYVSSSNLPGPRALPRRAEKSERNAHGPEKPGRYFVLLRWVPGEHKADDLDPAGLFMIGSHVAKLHNHAQQYRLPEGSGLPRRSAKGLFKGPPIWQESSAYSADEMEPFRAADRRVREDLARLGKNPEVFGVIHGDLGLENVIFDGRRVGSIDFDRCGLGHYLLDVATIRRDLENRYPGRQEQMWTAFVEGYERERPLPEDYQRYLTTFDVVRRVREVNREIKRFRREGNARQTQAAQLLRGLVNWLEELSYTYGVLAAALLSAGSEPWLDELSYAVGAFAQL
ncbi:MAG: phosphotransferase [Rubrobacter sp.]|nr:phosphotransferase [Rubrobacter sp.]